MRRLLPLALVGFAGGVALADSTLYDFDSLLDAPYPLSRPPTPAPSGAPPLFTSGVPLPPPPQFDTPAATPGGLEYGRPAPPQTAPVAPSAAARGTATGHIGGMLDQPHPFDLPRRAPAAPEAPEAPVVLRLPAPAPAAPAAPRVAAPALSQPTAPAEDQPPEPAATAPPPPVETVETAPEPAAVSPPPPVAAAAEPPPEPAATAPPPPVAEEPEPEPSPRQVAPELDRPVRTGFYLAGHFSTYLQPDSSVSGSGASLDAEYKVGFGGWGAAGYMFDFGLRAEAEIGYRQASVDTFAVRNAGDLAITVEGGSSSANGSVGALSGLANAFYEFDTGGRFGPYVGGGGGVGVARVDLNKWRAGGDIADDSETVFAYQAGVGTSIVLTRTVKADLGYRYFATDDVSVGSASGGTITIDYETHNFVAGLRFGL